MSKKRGRLDKINVVDLETTCWEEKNDTSKQDIIEIGIVQLCQSSMTDEATPPHRAGQLYVYPTRSGVNAFCTSLTGITPETVEHQPTLPDRIEELRNGWDSRDLIWASWGDFDRVQFLRECEAKALPYPFGRRHINVKTLYALVAGLSEEVGLDTAVSQLGWEFVGKHHSGVDDAMNVVAVLRALLVSGMLSSYAHSEVS